MRHVNMMVVALFVVSMISCSAFCEEAAGQADSALDREAMEIGGLVTVDLGSRFNELAHPALSIGSVELGANVIVSEKILATVVLLSEEDLSQISIDQAMASYKAETHPIEFYFGQHYFNHGLLTTRLISDPSLIDLVELANPGVTVTYGFSALILGAGGTVLDQNGQNNYASVLNADYAWNENSLIRVSSLLSPKAIDADIAVNASLGPFSADAETYMQFKQPGNARKQAGYFIGVAYSVNDIIEVALRHDGIGTDTYEAVDLRAAAGTTVQFGDGLFFALEISRTMPDIGGSFNEIAFQFGLESTLKLPGFQRKTLTRK